MRCQCQRKRTEIKVLTLDITDLDSVPGLLMVPQALLGVIPEHSQQSAPSTTKCGPKHKALQEAKGNRSLRIKRPLKMKLWNQHI